MKRNAIARIVIYSIVAVALICALVAGLSSESYNILFQLGGKGITVEGEMHIDATQVKNMQIDWMAGNVEIRIADTDQITISEVIPEDCKYKMAYQINGDTLKLSFSNQFFFGNLDIPEKDLIVTVPQDWVCGDLEIDSASITIDITGLNIGELDFDGASCTLNFTGSVDQVEIDGASTKVHLVCTNRVSSIQVDGASCNLELTLPKDCGFRVDMDGLSCDLQTALPYASRDGDHVYGDEHCKISVDGASCDVTIKETP